LDTLDPSCYNESDDDINSIDEFIHVRRRKRDVFHSILNGDPIYEMKRHFQSFPLEQPYVTVIDLDVWQHEYDMVKDVFQPHRDDVFQHSHDDFCSYLGRFDTCNFEHLDVFYQEEFQPSMFSNFHEGKDMIFLEQDFYDDSFHPFPFSPLCSIIDMVGCFPHDGHFHIRLSCFQPMFCCKVFQFHIQCQQSLD